jgi:hypothetical protein
MKKSYLVYSALAIFNLTVVAAIPIKNASAQEIPKAQCISNFGENACGYNCIANFGQVKCADWPGGTCIANFGQVVCGAPAPPNWTLGYTSSQGTTNPPRLTWTIAKHSMSIRGCQQRAYQVMQATDFTNLKTGGNSNLSYVAGNINNNTSRIACQNNTVVILVAGSDLQTVGNLYNSIKKYF